MISYYMKMPKLERDGKKREQREQGKTESKYYNRKIVIDGIRFDSEAEGNRYAELKLLLRAGEISDLRMQVSYTLIPNQKDESGKTIERAVKYKADFVYLDRDGNTVVEDVKGAHTREYVIKRKLMLKEYGIKIKEISNG